jgi:hypothetical protein
MRKEQEAQPCAGSRRNYRFAMDQFITWYCSEPLLALNRTVVLRFRLYLESLGLAAATINQRLAAVRRPAYEAADSGLLSPEARDSRSGANGAGGDRTLGTCCRAGSDCTGHASCPSRSGQIGAKPILAEVHLVHRRRLRRPFALVLLLPVDQFGLSRSFGDGLKADTADRVVYPEWGDPVDELADGSLCSTVSRGNCHAQFEDLSDRI